MLPAILLSLLFLALSLIHFYWALGGQRGFAAALPTNQVGERVLNPKPIDSLIVGLGLLVFSLVYGVKAGIVRPFLPDWVISYSCWIIPAIFLLRAIGDFRYVGFFKRVKDTDFARLDTWFFAPLCFVVGLIGALVLWLNR